MQKINEFLLFLNDYLGGHQWFVFFLLGTGIFFTIYLGLPQFRYFKHAIGLSRASMIRLKMWVILPISRP